MKPTWDDAPNWANWMALDKNGSWYFFEFEPTPQPNMTESDMKKFCSTLERRPTTEKTFKQKRAEIEQKINQGARLTTHKLHHD